MHTPADIAREQDAGLQQLFQAGLELALQVQANAMAAQPEAQARLSLTFHRLSRGVRQTAALRMKLAHDATRSDREQAAEVVKLETARAEKRQGQVKAGVEALIWTEAEGVEAFDELQGELEERLQIEVQDDQAFLAEPLAAQVARIAHCIGLPPPPCGVEERSPSGEQSTNACRLQGRAAGGGGVGAERAAADTDPQAAPATHDTHPHPNPSPQGGGAPDFHPSG